MAGAVIGALRVNLGLNSADFEQGLKNATSGLGNFAKTAGVGLAAVGVAAAAAGTALAYAVKGAIDNADHMGEMAQSIGVSVEALTSLGYAAKLSGADAEGLSTGLRKLSQNMLAVAQGSTGPAATAFQMLGISAQNANGSLRASDQVLIDVADKFARMEDGATKTALAVQLFGKSGADLIPFLNQGRDGIGALTAEADRLGITISGSTANAAGQFNDTLDRMNATFGGVVNKIMEEAMPALNNLAETMASPAFAAAAQQIGGAIVQAMDLAAKAVISTIGAFNQLRTAMDWANTHDIFGNDLTQTPAYLDKKKEQATFGAYQDLRAGKMSAPDDSFFSGILGAPGDPAARAAEASAAVETLNQAFEPVITNTKEAGAAASSLNAIMGEGKAVFEATRTPAEAYALEVENLNRLLQAGAIDQDTYNRAIVEAQDYFSEASLSANQFAGAAEAGLSSFLKDVSKGNDGLQSLGDTLGNVADMLIDMAVKNLFAKAFGGLTGSSGGGFDIGGIISSIFGGGSRADPIGAGAGAFSNIAKMLPKFASEGSIKVGGSGGIDSQMVGLMASPNEHISVTKGPPDAGNGTTVNIYNQNGSSVKTKEKEGPNGRREMEIFIQDTVRDARRRGAAGF